MFSTAIDATDSLSVCMRVCQSGLRKAQIYMTAAASLKLLPHPCNITAVCVCVCLPLYTLNVTSEDVYSEKH